MRIPRPLYPALALLFWCPASNASLPGKPSILFGELMDERSGLSHDRVNEIYQDSLGFLWIGTGDGLVKYDGYSFEQFRYQPDTLSLSGNKIRCIEEGSDGVLWIGTDNGLNKLDRLKGYLWSCHYAGFVDSSGRSGQAIRGILVDEDKGVWVRTDNRIEKFDPATGLFSGYDLYYDSPDASDDRFIRDMVRDRTGKIWMGTADGLQVLDPVMGQVVRVGCPEIRGKAADDWDVRGILADHNGRIWLGSDKGLFWYDDKEDLFRNAAEKLGEMEGADVYSLARTAGGDLVAGLRAGIMMVETDLGSAKYFESFNHMDMVIKFAPVYRIFEDASEILWIGTDRGLVKIDGKDLKFDVLSSLSITSILEEENGDLWLGSYDRGLHLIRAGNKKAVVYSSNASSRHIAHDHIYAIHKDASGNVWIGTGNGVDVLNAGSRQFQRFCDREAGIPCNLFDGQRVYDIGSDSGGHIWFASSAGVYRYDPRADTIQTIRRIYNGLEMMDLQDVYSILEDRKGRIWFGSSTGLIRYEPLSGDFNVYQAGISKHTSNINSNTVNCLMLDSRDRLWIGTASGLNRYDEENNRFEYFPDPVDLSEIRIYSMQEDSRGNLWMSSDRGLTFYDPELETLIKYGPSDGLQNYEFFPRAGFTAENGRMYFGGVAGLNTFHPDSIPYNKHIPPLSFTQFARIREQGGQSKPLALDRVSKVIVPRGVQLITIRFSALDFTFPERNRYMYKMVKKGQDGLWIHNGEQHHVTFYSLSPGNYSLSIRGSNNDLLYNEEEVSLEIVIPYSIWGKGLAVALYVLAGMILLYFGIQIRTRSLRKSNRILREKEISAIEISRQREELAMKNKNITDSINYAKRIQNALLPTWDNFKTIFPESFVLFKPKDIVSGDFYWINQHGNKIYVAAVDCTGHGVPGAFVSIIGFELFRKITTSEQGSNPAMILDTLNDNFAEIFSDGEQVYLNDGMDLSLCVIDKKEKSLDFAGAFNPLYLVRNETIIEVKADRFSVGADVHASASRQLFKSHKIFLHPDDMLYIFSDGYADQFGGPEGKKFKYRRFRHLLLTIHKLPLDKQAFILEESIEEWKGDTEQIDDILVIGIRPDL